MFLNPYCNGQDEQFVSSVNCYHNNDILENISAGFDDSFRASFELCIVSPPFRDTYFCCYNKTSQLAVVVS